MKIYKTKQNHDRSAPVLVFTRYIDKLLLCMQLADQNSLTWNSIDNLKLRAACTAIIHGPQVEYTSLRVPLFLVPDPRTPSRMRISVLVSGLVDIVHELLNLGYRLSCMSSAYIYIAIS